MTGQNDYGPTEKEKALKGRLTDDFLDTLVEAARIVGHSGDWVELKSFVECCFDMADKEAPVDLEPY